MSPKKKLEKRLILISAPSGAGKTTLCEKLLKEFPNVRLSISSTTRPMRPYEKNGQHYFFISQEDFQHKIFENKFAEWAEVHGNLYGTSKEMIEDFFAKGFHVLFDIDVQGALSLRKTYGARALLIFIHPPSIAELEKRLHERKGDSKEAIAKRLKNALHEITFSKEFDYEITNDNLDRAYGELEKIIKDECL